MKTFTNIEQTERLRKLGLFPTTYNEHYDGVWTLGDLLDLMPKWLDFFEMRYEFSLDNNWNIRESNYPQVSGGSLRITYEDRWWYIDYGDEGFSGSTPQSEDLIEALVLAIELLAANGYNFKKKNLKKE